MLASMPQSFSRVVLRTIFSTKDRFAFLQNPEFRTEVHVYLGGCAKSLHGLPIQIGGVSDHAHLLTTLSRTIAIAEFVKEAKRASCKLDLRTERAVEQIPLAGWLCLRLALRIKRAAGGAVYREPGGASPGADLSR